MSTKDERNAFKQLSLIHRHVVRCGFVGAIEPLTALSDPPLFVSDKLSTHPKDGAGRNGGAS
jgi:hypothetical protein